jgi:Flp pilus assembly protein TadD
MSVQETLDRALALHRTGALAEATGLYRQALEVSGGHPTIANFLAIALDQQGEGLAAERILEGALAAVADSEPEAAEAALNLARLRARRAGAVV